MPLKKYKAPSSTMTKASTIIDLIEDFTSNMALLFKEDYAQLENES